MTQNFKPTCPPQKPNPPKFVPGENGNTLACCAVCACRGNHFQPLGRPRAVLGPLAPRGEAPRKFVNSQVPPGSNLRGFQGPRGPAHVRVAATTWVPMRAGVPLLSPNDHPNPGFEKSQFFENFRVLLNSARQQFQGVWAAHGPGHMGLAATMWVPMGARVPILSPNDEPMKGFSKSLNFRTFPSATEQQTKNCTSAQSPHHPYIQTTLLPLRRDH